MTKKTLAVIETAVMKLVNDFLCERGGLNNGYGTWVTNDGWDLEWATPDDSITIREKRNFALALDASIAAVEKKYRIKIRLTASQIEDGCWMTTLSVRYPAKRIFLSFNNNHRTSA